MELHEKNLKFRPQLNVFKLRNSEDEKSEAPRFKMLLSVTQTTDIIWIKLNINAFLISCDRRKRCERS